MKTFYFTFIFFNLCLAGQGQVVENKIRKFTTVKNIENFSVYDYSCNYDMILGDCGWEEPHYLFWQQLDKWNIKRFDYCETFKTIQFDNRDSLVFYFENFNRIEGSNLKQQISKTTKRNHRKKISGEAAPVRFTCLYTFNYNSKGQSKKIVEDAYYLKLEKSNNSEETAPLINKSQDERKSLILITENLIKELNDEKKFVVE